VDSESAATSVHVADVQAELAWERATAEVRSHQVAKRIGYSASISQLRWVNFTRRGFIKAPLVGAMFRTSEMGGNKCWEVAHESKLARPDPCPFCGIPQKPMEGVSFMYTFDAKNADEPSHHHTQYFEMMGDHAIYHDGWIASTKVMRPPWVVAGAVSQDPASYPYELYDLTKGLDPVRQRSR
jgi:hypothetical protein